MIINYEKRLSAKVKVRKFIIHFAIKKAEGGGAKTRRVNCVTPIAVIATLLLEFEIILCFLTHLT